MTRLSDNVHQAILDQIESLADNSHDHDCFALIKAAVEYDAVVDSGAIEDTVKSLLEDAINADKVDQEYVNEMIEFCENQSIDVDGEIRDNIVIEAANKKAANIAQRIMEHVPSTLTANQIALEIREIVQEMSEHFKEIRNEN
jgi:hypothetical protein